MLDCRAASGNTRDQVNYSNFINGRCCVFTLLSSYLDVLGVIFSPNGKMIHPYKLGKKCKYGCWYRLLIIVQSNFDNPNIRLIWTKFFFPRSNPHFLHWKSIREPEFRLFKLFLIIQTGYWFWRVHFLPLIQVQGDALISNSIYS